MAWPDGGTNPDPKSIGVTARDYATIDAWEQATDIDIVTAQVSPVGDCYDDGGGAGGDFEEDVYLYGATTSADYYRTWTVHEGNRHNGTNGNGVRCTSSTANAYKIRDKYAVVEWLILSGAGSPIIAYYIQPADSRGMVRFCVIVPTGTYGINNSGPGSGTLDYIENCVLHSSGYGIVGSFIVRNCSVFCSYKGVNNSSCTNTISIGSSEACFTTCTGSNNISGDTTDAGADTINNVAAADIFTNAGAGTEDLHLKNDATVASGAGIDLSAYFTLDIDGNTRSDWDIGADEYVTAGVTVSVTTGTIIVASLNPEVEVGTTVDVAVGAVTVASYNPEVEIGTTVNVTLGTVVVASYNVEVEVGTTVEVTLGIITVASFNPEVKTGITVSATLGAVVLASLNPEVEVGTTVNATPGTVTVVGLNPEVEVGTTVFASLGIVTVARLNPEVEVGVTISATLGAAVITSFNPEVEVGTTVEVTLGTISVASLNPEVEVGVTVASTLGLIVVASFNPEVEVGTTVSATVGTLTVAGYNATVDLGGAIPLGIFQSGIYGMSI